MTEVTLIEKENQHFYDTEIGILPSSTTILSILRKPAIEVWMVKTTCEYLGSRLSDIKSGKLELTGQNAYRILQQAKNEHARIRDEAASIGSKVHKLIELYLNNIDEYESYYANDLSELNEESKKKVMISFDAFLKWQSENQFEVIDTELAVYSKKYAYGGTLDIIGLLNNKLFVLDLKTSKNFWEPEFGMQLCLDADTEVLSTNGWKKYYELGQKDKILTFNHRLEISEFQSIKRIYVYKNSDIEMFHLKSKHIDQLLTPNHKVIYKTRKEFNWKNKEISRIDNKSLLYIPIAYPIREKKDYRIDDNIIKIIGWIITEGSRSGAGYVFSQSETVNSKYCDEIDNIFKSLRWEVSDNRHTKHYIERGLRVWYIKKKYVDYILLEKNHKVIPLWILQNLSIRQLHILFDTLMKGDGSVGKRGDLSYSASDSLARYRFMHLCAILGLKATMGRNNKDIYITKNGHIHYNCTTPKIDKVPYSGITWCPSTSNGFIIILRNGKMSITGNSSYRYAYEEMNNVKVRGMGILRLDKNDGMPYFKSYTNKEYLKALKMFVLLSKYWHLKNER